MFTLCQREFQRVRSGRPPGGHRRRRIENGSLENHPDKSWNTIQMGLARRACPLPYETIKMKAILLIRCKRRFAGSLRNPAPAPLIQVTAFK
jgi:hypothetical protein